MKKGKKKELTILDTFRVSDGRAIGDVKFCELQGLMENAERSARLIQELMGEYGDMQIRIEGRD